MTVYFNLSNLIYDYFFFGYWETIFRISILQASLFPEFVEISLGEFIAISFGISL